MLSFSEFRNILQLIASEDSECNILGQELAKQYRFGPKDSILADTIRLDKYYVVYENHLRLLWDAKTISYEQAYEKYLTQPHTRGI